MRSTQACDAIAHDARQSGIVRPLGVTGRWPPLPRNHCK